MKNIKTAAKTDKKNISIMAYAFAITKALTLMFALTAFLAGCGDSYAEGRSQDLGVGTAAAAVKQLEGTVEVAGVLTPDNTATVASKLSGAVASVNASAGQTVNAGDVLASLDVKELNAQLATAKAAYDMAQSQSELAKVNLDAARSGFDATESSVADQIAAAKLAMDAAETALNAVSSQNAAQLEQSRLQTEQAQIGINNAQSGLENATGALEIAQKNYDRTVRLIDADASPEANLDTAQSSLNAAQSGVNAARAAVDQAQAALKTAQAAYSLALQNTSANRDAAQAKYDGAKAAHEQAEGSGAKSQIVAAQGRVDTASEQYRISSSAGLEQAQAAIDSIDIQLSNALIRANINGVVVTRNVNEGEIAAAGSPLFTLADVSKLKLKGTFSQEALPYIKEGLSVDVVVDIYPDRTFPGTVTSYGPIAVSTGSYFPCEITIDNQDGALAAGVSAHATIHVAGNSRVVAPSRALVENNGQSYVFIIKDGVAYKTDVVPGLKNGTETEILRGLEEGDEVAITNVNTLFDQMPVNMSAEAAASAAARSDPATAVTSAAARSTAN